MPIEPDVPVEPAGPVEVGSGAEPASRESGSEPSVAFLIPAGIAFSSDVICSPLTPWAVTSIETSWNQRRTPSPTAVT